MGRLGLQVSLAQLWHTRMHVKNLSSSSTVTKWHLPVSAGGDKVAFTSSCTPCALGWRSMLHLCSPCQQGVGWAGALPSLSWHLPWWETEPMSRAAVPKPWKWLLHLGQGPECPGNPAKGLILYSKELLDLLFQPFPAWHVKVFWGYLLK